MTMPDFLFIGAEKAGTTSLYHYLKQHPQIYLPDLKEPGFFAWVEETKFDYCGPGDQKVMQEYAYTLEDYQALFRNVRNEKVVGEASTIYLFHLRAPERIKRYLPNAKLIAVLRHPAERAYSNFLMRVRAGRETVSDFSAAIEEEEARQRNNWLMGWQYVRKGFYSRQLTRYFDLFKREQLKIYLYEDLCRDPLALMKDIYRFLEVDESFVPDITVQYNRTEMVLNHRLDDFLENPHPVKSGIKHFIPQKIRSHIAARSKKMNYGKPKLSGSVRSRLIDVYRKDILELEKLIGRDLSQWTR